MGHKIDPYTFEVIEWHLASVEFGIEKPHQTLATFSNVRGELQQVVCDAMYNESLQRIIKLTEERRMSTANKITDPDEIVGSAISKAIRHAENVARREHIKADRIERVNQFLVSLRRELGYIASMHPYGTQLANSLLRKDLWYDVGEIHPSYPTYGVSFSRDTLLKWVQIAKRLRKSDDAATDEIKGDLEELERSMAGMTNLVMESGRIAEEGEQVACQLAQLLN